MNAYSKPTGASVIPTVRYRDVSAAVAWLHEAFGLEPHRLVKDAQGAVLYGELTFGSGMVMVAPIQDFAARRPDGAARRDRRCRNADLLSVRGQRQGALRPRQGRGRRDRAGHRGGGHRRSRIFLSRSRRTRVEFRHPQSLEHPNCGQRSPGVAPHLEGPRRVPAARGHRHPLSAQTCAQRGEPPCPHDPGQVSTSIEPALAEQTPDRAGDDAALRDMRDQLSKERLARVAADRQVSDIREQLAQERRGREAAELTKNTARVGCRTLSFPALRMPP